MKRYFIYCVLMLGWGSIMTLQAQEYPSAEEFMFVDQQPSPINLSDIRAAIGYPKEAVDQNIEGNIICRILVDENGQYVRHLIMSSGHSILQKAVEKHIPKLTFSPASLDGKNVAFWINVPFKFKLISENVRILEDAVKSITDSLTGDKENPGMWYRRGVYYLKLNQLKDATSDFDQSILINPKKNAKKASKNSLPYLVKAYFGKATVMDKEGDKKGAIYHYSQAIKTAEEMRVDNEGITTLLPQIHLQRGYLHLETDSVMDQAKADLQFAIADTGEIKCTAYQLLADIGIEEKDNENLVKYYDGLVECYPDQDYLKYSRGYYAAQAGQYEKAIKDFEYVAEKVKITQLQLATYNQMANCYLQQKDFDNALASIEKALVINILNGESYYYRAIVKLEQGKKEDACKDFQKSVDYQSDGLYLEDAVKQLKEICGVEVEEEE